VLCTTENSKSDWQHTISRTTQRLLSPAQTVLG
jgi:hypothetical protein